MQANNGWGEWSRFVLKELERLNTAIEQMEGSQSRANKEIYKELSEIRTEIATLQLKAGVWGLLGAAIPITLMMIAQLIK